MQDEQIAARAGDAAGLAAFLALAWRGEGKPIHHVGPALAVRRNVKAAASQFSETKQPKPKKKKGRVVKLAALAVLVALAARGLKKKPAA